MARASKPKALKKWRAFYKAEVTYDAIIEAATHAEAVKIATSTPPVDVDMEEWFAERPVFQSVDRKSVAE